MYTFLKDEDEKYLTNCFRKCKYNYYFTKYGDYNCVEDSICPQDYPLYIKDKNKCTHDCSLEKTYKYQYSGECYKGCPAETQNDSFICSDINENTCKLSNHELNPNTNLSDIINKKSMSYSQEFNDTINHVSYYNSQNFSMTIYKNSLCISELQINIPQIDFSDCYNKVQKDNNLTDKELIISVINIKKQI